MPYKDKDEKLVLKEYADPEEGASGESLIVYLHRWPDPRPQLWVDWRRPAAVKPGGHGAVESITQFALHADTTVALAASLGVETDGLLGAVEKQFGDGDVLMTLRGWCDDHGIAWVQFTGEKDERCEVLSCEEISNPAPGDSFASFRTVGVARDALAAWLDEEIKDVDEGVVAAALRLSCIAHAWQADKTGQPYFEHPHMVAGLVERRDGTPEETAVAWLCDALNHTWVTLDFLASAGFPPVVVNAVDSVTRRAGERADKYARRVAADSIAQVVRQAELEHSGGPRRCSTVTQGVPDYERWFLFEFFDPKLIKLTQLAFNAGHCATPQSVILDALDEGIKMLEQRSGTKSQEVKG